MVFPKLKFYVQDIEDLTRLIRNFLYPESGAINWSSVILREYPDLKSILEKSDTNRQNTTIQDYFNKLNETENEKLLDAADLFQQSWDSINDQIMAVLSEVNEIEWPEDYKNIKARVSLNPICPRYLQFKAFDVYYKFSNEKMKAIAIHEISHFIFFEKWKKVFPDYSSKEFESPHLIWKISEMVPAIILNDRRIQKIFPHTPQVYKIWYDTKVNNKHILEYLKELYKSRSSFEDFLRKVYYFVSEHKDIF